MNVKPRELYNILREQGIDFFTGVPDSLLKDFYAEIVNNSKKNNNMGMTEHSHQLEANYYMWVMKIVVRKKIWKIALDLILRR